MLELLKRIANNAIHLDRNRIVRKALDNQTVQQAVIAMNQKQLYDEGVFADGSPTGNYAKTTLDYKINEAGLLGRDTRTDHVTFKDKGDLYDTIRFENGEKGFALTGNTVKEGVDLEDTYRAPIVGLTPDSIGKTIDLIKPDLIEITRNELLKRD